jgi:hypothetical protein
MGIISNVVHAHILASKRISEERLRYVIIVNRSKIELSLILVGDVLVLLLWF